MKRAIFFLAVVMAVTVMVFPAQAAPDITITVNGSRIDTDVKPYIDPSNRTMVPIRFVAEALGSEVKWEQKTKEVTVQRRDNNVLLRVDKKEYTVNGKGRMMDTVPVLLPPGRTMVPIRFVAEALGCTVDWDKGTRTVIIIMDNGYMLPEETDMQIDMYPPDDNPNQVDISMLILMYKDMEAQKKDVYNILNSKFGQTSANEITDYAFSKKDRFDILQGKLFYFEGQEIWVISGSGDAWVQVTIYLSEE